MPDPLELDAMIDAANDWIKNTRQFVSRVADPDVTNVFVKVYKILELQNVALAKVSELIKNRCLASDATAPNSIKTG
jgi:hypothetical protein